MSKTYTKKNILRAALPSFSILLILCAALLLTSCQPVTGPGENPVTETRELYPQLSGNLWGYINIDGRFIIEPRFTEAGLFCDDLARAKEKGHWGFIDRSGVFVIGPAYDELDDFSEGLARVSVAGRWGFIDRQGQYVINLQYESAHSFQDGLARVRQDGKWGYIDLQGN